MISTVASRSLRRPTGQSINVARSCTTNCRIAPSTRDFSRQKTYQPTTERSSQRFLYRGTLAQVSLRSFRSSARLLQDAATEPQSSSPDDGASESTETTAMTRGPSEEEAAFLEEFRKQPQFQLQGDQIAKVDAILHKILWLDLFETSMLNDLIQHKLGRTITPQQRRAIERQLDLLERQGGTEGMSGGASGGEAEEEAAEQGPTLVDLKLMAFDSKAKIKVIKEVRAVIPGLGLKEAKELVEGAPKILQKDMKMEQAQELQQRLQEVGAEIELVEK